MDPTCIICEKAAVRVCVHPLCDKTPFICGDVCKFNQNMATIIHTHNGENKFVPIEDIFDNIKTIQQNSNEGLVNDVRKKVNLIIGDLNELIERYEKAIRSVEKKINTKTLNFIEKVNTKVLNQSLIGKDLSNFLESKDIYQNNEVAQQKVEVINQQMIKILNKINELELKYVFDLNLADQSVQKGDQHYQKHQYQKALVQYFKVKKIGLASKQLQSKILICEKQKTQMYELYSFAQQLFNKNQFQKSLEYFNKLILNHPNFADYYYHRGCAFQKLDKPKKAIQDFDQAININNTNPHYYYHRATCFKDIKTYDLSLKNVQKAIQLDANQSSFYCLRGVIYHHLSNTKSALIDFNKAIQLNNQIDTYYIKRSQIYLNQGNYSYLLQDITTAIKINGTHFNYQLRSSYFFLLGQNKKAIFDISKAIELNPTNINYYKKRIQYYQSQEQYQNGINDLTLVISMKPTQLDYCYCVRGSYYEQILKYDLALSDYSKAIELNKNSAQYYSRRANIYKLLKNNEKSLEDYTISIKLCDDSDDSYYERGLIYKQLKNWKKAQKDFNKCISLNEQNSLYYLARGLLFYQKQQDQKAIKDFNKAIALDNTKFEYYLRRGNAYQQLQQQNKALDDLNKAVKLSKQYQNQQKIKDDLAYCFYSRGLIKNCKGNDKEAILDYSQAIKLVSTNPQFFYRRASSYLLMRQFQKGLKDINQTFKFKQMDKFYFCRAQLFFSLQKYQQALTDINKAINMNSNYKMYFLIKSNIYRRLGQQQKSNQSLERMKFASELCPLT